MSETLTISRAMAGEYPEVRDFYYSLTDALEGTRYHPEWKKDVYPSQEELLSAVTRGTLYVGRAGGRIAAAMVVNQSCNEAYRSVNWPVTREQKDFAVIHMLGVHRDFGGKGYAKELVRYALSLARETGMKAVRLDVLEGNVPAERLYAGLGFSFVGMVPMFYEDTGWKNFKVYEYDLQPGRDEDRT